LGTDTFSKFIRIRVLKLAGFAHLDHEAASRVLGYHFSTLSGGWSMWLEDHFGSGSMLQRNERVKLAASFWNNIGAGMVIGGMAAAFFLDKPEGTWTKIGIAILGLVLGWVCYSIASTILTYMHTTSEERR
jgi:MFS family permease